MSAASAGSQATLGVAPRRRGDPRQSLQTLLSAIEADRRAAKVSMEALCARAGFSRQHYWQALSGRRAPSADAVRKYRAALTGLLRGAAKASGTDAARDMVRAVIGGFLVAAAASHGVTAEEVRATLDGSEERTSNERWRACSHARQAAIYLANTSLGIEQARIADALGLTPAAVCLAIRSVETRRDAAAVDAALNGAEFAITGRAGF